MKLLNPTTLLILACFIAFLLFTGLECNNEDPPDTDPKCQFFRSFKVTWKHNPSNQGERTIDPWSHLTEENSLGIKLTYKIEETRKILCTKEATVADFYVTFKKDFPFESYLGVSIILNSKSHLPTWDHTEDEERSYFHAGKTISGDPNGTKADYELFLNVTILKKTGEEETDELLEAFNNAYESIQFDWAYTEW